MFAFHVELNALSGRTAQIFESRESYTSLLHIFLI
jgi:hypothetical protein